MGMGTHGADQVVVLDKGLVVEPGPTLRRAPLLCPFPIHRRLAKWIGVPAPFARPALLGGSWSRPSPSTLSPSTTDPTHRPTGEPTLL